MNRERELTKALLMCAASCQGGHSDAGMAASEALGIPFPIRMESLEAAAIREGFDPRELYPWWFRMREQRAAAKATQEADHADV